MTLPFARLLTALISLAILVAGAWLLWRWYDGVLVLGADGVWRNVRGPLWQLLLALLLLGLSLLGRFPVLLLLPSRGPLGSTREGERFEVTAPDGSRLNAESFGPSSAPTIVLTHGWGLSSRAWAPLRDRLEGRFRVIAWDLPGLGRSSEPPDGEYSLDRFAQALGSVVARAGTERVVLVGHSIGGMTSETFWRACPPELKARIAGVVLVHTTHTNPLTTMWLSRLWLALQKPVIEPAQRVSIVLSPLLWLSTWQSYLSGSLHLATWLVSFGRNASREAVELAARLTAQGSPRVQAKGNLAMLHWHMTDELKRIQAPTLVLAGQSDIITLPRAGMEIAERVPSASARLIEGVGHLGFLELDDVYAEAIATFAAQRLAPVPAAAAMSEP